MEGMGESTRKREFTFIREFTFDIKTSNKKIKFFKKSNTVIFFLKILKK